MLNRRLLRCVSRALVATLTLAYAQIAVHAYAAPVPPPVLEEQAAEGCHDSLAPAPPANPLLCKHHCLSATQTLDHPTASVVALPDAAVLRVPAASQAIAMKPLVDKAFRPDATHHGGSPPLYSSTARRRI
jgi:hypothetical protein